MATAGDAQSEGEAVNGDQRFHVKRAAGMSAVRADGTLFDPQTDAVADEIWTDARGRCRMRLELRGENGRPVNFYDEKKHRWVALKHVGVRRMNRTGPKSNEFRLQPYHDRSTSKAGEKYGHKAAAVAQEALDF